MRPFRKMEIADIVIELIFLTILIILIISTLLFWDKTGGEKSLIVLSVLTFFVILRIARDICFLKWNDSFYEQNILNRIRHEKLAFQERQKINQQREEIPGQIDARLNKVLTSNLFYFRMMQSKVFIRLFVLTITSLIFWGIFNFRVRLSLIPGLIAGFLAGEIWQRIVRYRIASIFEKEFPSGSPEREAAIEHLSENTHAYWFAPELLKVVTNHFSVCK